MRTKITAILLAAAMVLGLAGMTGCADTRSAMTVGDTEISAGEFIYAQLVAAQRGVAIFEEDNPDINTRENSFDFFAQTIEGKSFADWVNDEAVEVVKRNVAVSLMFDELGLELPPDARRDIRETTDGLWNADFGLDNFDTWGSFYENAGVVKSTFTQILTYVKQQEELFFAIFGEGGTEEVSEDELRVGFVNEYVRFRLFFLPLTDMDGDLLLDDEISELKERAQDYANRLNAGEPFNALEAEHEAFLDEWFKEMMIAAGEMLPDDEHHDHENENESYDDEDYTPTEEPEEEDELDENFFDMKEKRSEAINPFFIDERREFIFNMQVGAIAIYEEEEFIIVYQKLDISEREDWFEEVRADLLTDLFVDVLIERIDARAAALKTTINEAALRRYNPQRIARRELL